MEAPGQTDPSRETHATYLYWMSHHNCDLQEKHLILRKKHALSRNCWKLKSVEKAVFAPIRTNKQTEPTIRLEVPVREAMQVSELKLEATMTLLKEILDNRFNISSNLRCVHRPERRCLEAPSQTGPASEIYAT